MYSNMNKFIEYLKTKTNLKGRSLETIPSAIRIILKRIDETDLDSLIKKKDDIKELFESDTYSPTTVNSYVNAIKLCLKSMNLNDEKLQEIIKFYSEISSTAIAAYKNSKNPNRPIRVKGIRNDVALEVYQKKLADYKKQLDSEKNVPDYVPTESRRTKHVGLLYTSNQIPSKDLDIIKRINNFKYSIVGNNGSPILDTTKELYGSNIVLVIKRYNAYRNYNGEQNLEFITREPDKVVEWLETLPLTTGKAFETAIVKFLPLSDSSIDEQQNAYKIYTEWLRRPTTLRNPAPRKKEFFGHDYITGEDKKLYTWKILKANVEFIIKNEKPTDVQKMFMLLFTCQPPRRSKDYTDMLINVPDDKIHNIFQSDEKRFIFNSYKNIVKSGPQTVEIRDKNLISELNKFVKKNKNNKYLFQRPNSRFSVTKDDIQKILRDNIGKRFKIPFGVNALRHLFASYLKQFVHSRDFDKFAYEMGTSVKMLHAHYIDEDEKGELDDN